MGEVQHRELFMAGGLRLAAICRNKKIGLISESTPDVKSIERPQGVTFEAAEGLLKDILGKVAEIGVGEVGLHGRLEALIVLGGKSPLAHQPAQSRDQLGQDENTDSEGVRLSTKSPHLLRPLLPDIALGQGGGVEKDPHRFSSRSARTSSPRLRPPKESRVWGGFFQAGIAALTGTMSATGRPLR